MRIGPRQQVTPEAIAAYCEAIRAGQPVSGAAAAIGISSRTAWRWLAKGGEEVEPYAAFYAAVQKAQAERVGRWVTCIEQAAAEDWKAAAWLLERLHPEEFGRSVKQTVAEEIKKFLTELKGRVAGETWREVMRGISESVPVGGPGVSAPRAPDDPEH